MFFVPVVDSKQQPLMPTTILRAKKWIASKKATPFWKRGIFCVRLNVDPSNNQKQEIAVGIDPGGKKEGFSIKSKEHTYLNIQTDAVTWVKDAVEVRRNMRRTRRQRKTPCRKNRMNRSRGCLPPSTKARWQWKLRIANWLLKMFPISVFVVEDIKAKPRKGQKKWNSSFSPLEVGKKWFYSEVNRIGKLELKLGFDTAKIRASLGLKKSKNKLSDKFEAHCVDSWCLAYSSVGGKKKPDNTNLLLVTPLHFHRRQLHMLQPAKGNIRRSYGGTISLGLKRGSLVKHKKYGIVYVGGTSKDRISVHSVETGERLARNIKVEDCKFLTYNSWRISNSPTAFRPWFPCCVFMETECYQLRLTQTT